ncbi:hypothetical protein AAHA92_20265 [Salvia divinorum]|uniref:Uncharacterized protein n=1 Tax=Salvia divinorum TaxID=28513 RepID=A0ABD1GGM5_SALDI
MSRAFSLLVLIGFLILVATPSLARDLDDNASLLDSNLNKGFGEDEILNIESLKRHRHRRGRHAPPPHSHGAPKHGRRHAPPPHSHDEPKHGRRHAPPPHHRHHAPPPEMF